MLNITAPGEGPVKALSDRGSTPLASTNLIAGRTLEHFDEKIIRSAKILHIRVGFSFIVLPHPGSCTAGARYTRRKEVTL